VSGFDLLERQQPSGPTWARPHFPCQLNLSCFVCETTGSYPSWVLKLS
jgi:hypothetical protein